MGVGFISASHHPNWGWHFCSSDLPYPHTTLSPLAPLRQNIPGRLSVYSWPRSLEATDQNQSLAAPTFPSGMLNFEYANFAKRLVAAVGSWSRPTVVVGKLRRTLLLSSASRLRGPSSLVMVKSRIGDTRRQSSMRSASMITSRTRMMVWPDEQDQVLQVWSKSTINQALLHRLMTSVVEATVLGFIHDLSSLWRINGWV